MIVKVGFKGSVRCLPWLKLV